jgi:hypothetical protein
MAPDAQARSAGGAPGSARARAAAEREQRDAARINNEIIT